MKKPYSSSIYENVDRISLIFDFKDSKRILRSVMPRSLESRAVDLELFGSGADSVQIVERSQDLGFKTKLYQFKRAQYSAIRQEKGASIIELVYMRVHDK